MARVHFGLRAFFYLELREKKKSVFAPPVYSIRLVREEKEANGINGFPAVALN